MTSSQPQVEMALTLLQINKTETMKNGKKERIMEFIVKVGVTEEVEKASLASPCERDVYPGGWLILRSTSAWQKAVQLVPAITSESHAEITLRTTLNFDHECSEEFILMPRFELYSFSDQVQYRGLLAKNGIKLPDSRQYI